MHYNAQESGLPNWVDETLLGDVVKDFDPESLAEAATTAYTELNRKFRKLISYLHTKTISYRFA